MASKRFLIFIVAALVLIAAVAGGLWYILQSGREVGREDTTVVARSAVEKEAQRLRQLAQEGRAQGRVAPVAPQIAARMFLERYGSYSNQSNFENLEDLYPFMTARLRAAEEARVLKMRAALPAGAEYAGVSTKVVSVTLLRADSISAQVRAQTQRREQSANGQRTFYQAAELTLLKAGEAWKVDGVEWLPE